MREQTGRVETDHTAACASPNLTNFRCCVAARRNPPFIAPAIADPLIAVMPVDDKLRDAKPQRSTPTSYHCKDLTILDVTVSE